MEGGDAVADARVLARISNHTRARRSSSPATGWWTAAMIRCRRLPLPQCRHPLHLAAVSLSAREWTGSRCSARRTAGRGRPLQRTIPLHGPLRERCARHATRPSMTSPVAVPARWKTGIWRTWGSPSGKSAPPAPILPLAEFGTPRPDPVRVVTPDAETARLRADTFPPFRRHQGA